MMKSKKSFFQSTRPHRRNSKLLDITPESWPASSITFRQGPRFETRKNAHSGHNTTAILANKHFLSERIGEHRMEEMMKIAYQSTLNCPYFKHVCNAKGGVSNVWFIWKNNKNDKNAKIVLWIAPHALKIFEIVKNNVRFVISIIDNI